MLAFDDFVRSVSCSDPPSEIDPSLLAMWWAAKGDWNRAHLIVGDHEDDADCNLVHGHLHRAEGNLEGAQHWYALSARTMSDLSLEQEWNRIAAELLSARLGSRTP